LKNQNINIIFLGNKYDLAMRKLKKKISKDVVFFEDLSKSQSIIDQLYIHYNSKLCIGNPGGAFIISMYLQKKIIFIDSLRHFINRFPMMYEKNIINLFKKIIVNNKIQILNDRYSQKILKKKIIKYQIVETSFEEIKKSLRYYV
jgi:ADP-heptose:LPS heptosyltransferase